MSEISLNKGTDAHYTLTLMFVTHGEIGHKWQSIRGYKGPLLPETFISLHHLFCVSASTCQKALKMLFACFNICSVGEYHLAVLIIVFLLNVVLLDNQKAVHEVLVGVLSARHHYDLRQAIRDTWLGYIKQHPHFQNRSVLQTHALSIFWFLPHQSSQFTHWFTVEDQTW